MCVIGQLKASNSPRLPAFTFYSVNPLYTIQYRYLFSSHFYVIVKRWSLNEDKSKLRNIDGRQLKKFADSNNGEEAYIAIMAKGYRDGMKVNVGNNSIYTRETGKRKRRAAIDYQNAPLSENTDYAIFIRVFYDKNEVSIYILARFVLVAIYI